MMQDLSLVCLDIAMNSIRAKASRIEIIIKISKKEDVIILSVEDNGCGMSDDTLNKVCNPFFTTRTTRKVGLGLSFFKGLCEMCEGTFSIKSELNKGTKIQGTLKKSNWDTPPIGNIPETLMSLIQANGNNQLIFKFQSDVGSFILDTLEIQSILEGVSMLDASILIWIKEYTHEQLELLKEGGVL